MSKILTDEQKKIIQLYINLQEKKVVKKINIETKEIEYSDKIKKGRDIAKLPGDEEIVRAYILTKLVNECNYPIESIELETTYTAGRPHTITSRIDIIIRNENNDAFLFIELKSPKDYAEIDQDQVIEEQLFKVAGMERAEGNNVKYLALYTINIENNSIKDECIIIDNEKHHNFSDWKVDRIYGDEIPQQYGKIQKKPYKKGSIKDLETDFSPEMLDRLQNDLHNVLWGGGSTDDNEIFSSLTNILLAKIQDEDETGYDEIYKFQSMTYEKDEDIFESNDDLFERINELYRRALKNRLNIDDSEKINKSYVIDQNKFSLTKLKYAVQKLEKYSFIAGKNSLSGKDILGDFFEGIIRNGFKQSKGQFFTPINVVSFMLWAVQADKLAIDKINTSNQLPYFIDSSAGSGTFLIEYMKFITKNIKYKYKSELGTSRIINNKLDDWFFPDNRENKWAKEYIYGSELNFNLGTAIKVNMILHGDGSSNIFVGGQKGDGLLSFDKYTQPTLPNVLNKISSDKVYPKDINGQFDLILTNPPFSVDLDTDTKKIVKTSFIFGDKKNSENLFLERYYQLLKENGRMGIVLPESIFDTVENKYIRLFLFKYFEIKAVVSLPQLTFAPFTNTKTSILFAQKKTAESLLRWNGAWKKYTDEYNQLKTRIDNLVKVYCDNQNREKYPSIKDLSNTDEHNIICKFLYLCIDEHDNSLSNSALIIKYKKEIAKLSSIDKDISNEFGFVNTSWVFSKVSADLDYEIFMAEADNIGYKKTLRNKKEMPNELYRKDKFENIIVDDGVKETILDYMREIKWS